MSFFNTTAVNSNQFGSNMQNVQNQPGVKKMVTAENPMGDIEVDHPPDDTITALNFSPPTLQSTFLVSSSWDNRVRCWEINQVTGKVDPKAEQVRNSSNKQNV